MNRELPHAQADFRKGRGTRDQIANICWIIARHHRAMKKLRSIALISHASKVMLKILQVKLQQCMNRELPDVQVGFRKGRGTKDQISNIRWIIKKQESSRKTSISALMTMPKPLTVWITINCGKF